MGGGVVLGRMLRSEFESTVTLARLCLQSERGLLQISVWSISVGMDLVKIYAFPGLLVLYIY